MRHSLKLPEVTAFGRQVGLVGVEHVPVVLGQPIIELGHSDVIASCTGKRKNIEGQAEFESDREWN